MAKAKRSKVKNRREPGLFGGSPDAEPVAREGEDPPRRRRRRRPLVRLAAWTATIGVWAAVAGAGLVAVYAYDLPDIGDLDNFTRRPSVTLLAADGSPLGAYGDLHGGSVPLGEMPRYLPDAVIATEDRRFREHFGLDIIGFARAAFVNLRERRVVQGGSTITQQLAKNVFLTSERTLRRKVQELLLALWLEQKFTKDQILSIYLNRVYLGAGTFGVEAASRKYFGKSARRLSLHEAAVIAGLLKAPSRYAPTADLARSGARAAQVLANMVDAGYLTATDATAASRDPLRLAVLPSAGRNARYFLDWVIDQITDFVGYTDSDLTVLTTLDPKLQREAEAQVKSPLADEGTQLRVGQAALVAMAPDGAVRAMIGGRDYGDSQFNRATTALRQPGSAFKPFVYLAAVEAGFQPTDVVEDAPISIDGWSPGNFDSTFRGRITIGEALSRSINTPTVRLAQKVGIDRVIATAQRLGIVSELRRDLSTALGASEVTLLELTGAFAAFASGGIDAWPHGIVEIRAGDRTVLYRRSGSAAGRVIRPEHSATMTEMLTKVVAEGTGRSALIDRPVAGKTGTSQDFRDAWFVGYTADLVTGVWLGNDDDSPMKSVSGGGLPAKLWRNFMLAAHRGLPVRPLRGAVPLMFDRPAASASGATGSN